MRRIEKDPSEVTHELMRQQVHAFIVENHAVLSELGFLLEGTKREWPWLFRNVRWAVARWLRGVASDKTASQQEVQQKLRRYQKFLVESAKLLGEKYEDDLVKIYRRWPISSVKIINW